MSETTPTTTALAPIAGAQPKSALIAFKPDGGVALNTMEEMFIFAKAVINSGLAPKDFKTPEAVLIAVQMGAEIGLAPMASLQNIAVINGKPGVYGDAGKALLRARGFDIIEMDGEEVKAKGFARCIIKHPRQADVSRTFSVDDAKKAGLWGKAGPWTQYPHRQMAWRAFWFAARDAAADVLKGLTGAEEAHDTPGAMKDVTPKAPAAGQRLSIVDEAPVAETPTTSTNSAPGAVNETPTAPAGFEGDKQTLIDLIENLMLDKEVSDVALGAAARKAGKEVPDSAQKLADIPTETLVWMLAYLKEGAK